MVGFLRGGQVEGVRVFCSGYVGGGGIRHLCFGCAGVVNGPVGGVWGGHLFGRWGSR